MPDGHPVGVPRWLVVSGLALLAFCFGVAYHWGTTNQRASIEVPLSVLRVRNAQVGGEAAECSKRLAKMFASGLRDKNSTILRAINVARDEQAKLAASEHAADARLTACNGALMNQRNDLAAKRAKASEQSAKLAANTAVLDGISADITRLRDTVGMQRTLLLDALRQARTKHYSLLRQLMEPLPSNTTEYDADLIMQYAPPDGATNLSMSYIASEFAPPEDRVEEMVNKFIARWKGFNYSAAEHRDIFIPTDDGPDTNATASVAVYFNRSTQEEEIRGLAMFPTKPAIRTTAYQLKALTTIGVCAYKHNNPNMTFPSKFRRVSNKSTVEYLNDTVTTPLVRYCSLCTSALMSSLFDVACAQDRPKRIYGSYAFWAARSMLRPTADVIDAARAKYNQLGLAGRTWMAVAFKNPVQLQNKCYARKPVQLHYLWARALTASEGSLFHAVNGTNRTEACQPTRATLFDALERLRQRFKLDAIVVSVETQEDEEFIRGSDFGGAAQVSTFRPTNAFEDVVDLTLASWATHVLLNRYSDHSQVLAEAFALRHGITATNMHFF